MTLLIEVSQDLPKILGWVGFLGKVTISSSVDDYIKMISATLALLFLDIRAMQGKHDNAVPSLITLSALIHKRLLFIMLQILLTGD